LIYADWLDDNGQPERAEFIRVQCLLARMDEDDARRPQLEARERELLDGHQDEWLGSLRPLLSSWTVRRGFLDAVAGPARIYLERAAIPRPATVRHLEVDLVGFEPSQRVIELMPESVARENVLFLLGLRGRTLVLAVGDPQDIDTLQKIQFILN